MTFYSILSWGVTVFLLGAAVYIYRPDLLSKTVPSSKTIQDTQAAVSRNIPKKIKNNKKVQAVKDAAKEVIASVESSAQSSGNEQRTSKKRKIISSPVNNTVTATTTQGAKTQIPRDVDHDVSDKEFAQQLARAQAGTKLQSSSVQAGGKGSRLALNSTAPMAEDESSTKASSTTGQDADDDMSSTDSSNQRLTSGKDISDMLEAPEAGPAALRLTNIPESKPKPAQPQKFEQVLSKKKRNEQAKREEQKRLREESDRLHEQKKQEQLRRARMAEGSSNQTKVDQFASSTNVWQNKSQQVTQAPATPVHAPLLDTFSAPSTTSESITTQPLSDITGTNVNTNSVNAARERIGENKTSALAASAREAPTTASWSDQVSEEEQIQRIRDETANDAWESVTNKKSKKKPVQSEADISSDTSSTPAQPAQRIIPPPASKTVQANGVSTNGTKASNVTAKSSAGPNRFENLPVANTSGLQDDEWEA